MHGTIPFCYLRILENIWNLNQVEPEYFKLRLRSTAPITELTTATKG